MKKIYKYILLIFLIWTILTFLWYFIPHRLLNVTYETNKPIKDFKGPMLVIASHNYPTVDAMIMCNESKYFDKNLNIVAEFTRGKINQFFKDLPYYTSYRKINIYSDKNNNLTEKCANYLNKKENVLILLQNNKKNKGIYYILKKAKVPILFAKIYKKNIGVKKSKSEYCDNFFEIFGGKFQVDYELINDYNLDQSPEDFMNYVKNILYNS